MSMSHKQSQATFYAEERFEVREEKPAEILQSVDIVEEE